MKEKFKTAIVSMSVIVVGFFIGSLIFQPTTSDFDEESNNSIDFRGGEYIQLVSYQASIVG